MGLTMSDMESWVSESYSRAMRSARYGNNPIAHGELRSASFKTGPKVSTSRFRPPSINMRLNWGANEHIMDRGFNNDKEKWSDKYKSTTAPKEEPPASLPAPQPGTAVAGAPPAPTAPTTPTAPTASASLPSPSTGQGRPTISMISNAFQQTPTGQTIGQIRTAWGAVRNARAQRRSSGTVI